MPSPKSKIEIDKEAAIRYIVTQIHTPRMSLELTNFLIEFGEHIRNSVILSKEIGMPIMEKPPTLDYSHITEKLIQDILMFEEVYTKSKQK